MRICIIGYGYVGKLFLKLYSKKYDTIFYDPFVRDSVSRKEANNCNLGIICVPTPSRKNKECDISIVEEAISWLETPLILIKSTISIGTTDFLKEKYQKRIVFSPEYCGESDYDTGPFNFNKCVENTPFFIFGGDRGDTSEMVSILQPITGPSKKYIQTSAKEAEIAKYMENTFYGMKVVFCYEMDQVCKRWGADFNEVRELWLNDPRISRSHTSVFQQNDAPFGGKCLPKDINGLVKSAEEKGYDPKFIKEILESNKRIENLRK